ncbi:hypothetical protein [Sphaerochaeta sp. S2]
MTVMDIRSSDDGTDGDAAVSNIQMQLVALCEQYDVFTGVR